MRQDARFSWRPVPALASLADRGAGGAGPPPVPTALAAFVGATRLGPVAEPVVVRSLAEHVAVFGAPTGVRRPLGHLVAQFFANGGREAVVVRVLGDGSGSPLPADIATPSGAVTGMRALDVRPFPRFTLLCLAGVTTADTSALREALTYCRQERALLLVDPPPADAECGPVEDVGLGALGAHGAAYCPQVSVAVTAADGSTRAVALPPSGAVAGVLARFDEKHGLWRAPAGLEAALHGVIGLAGEPPMTNPPRTGALAVNTLRPVHGHGVVVWGARTLAGDEPGEPESRHLPVRRLTDHVTAALELRTAALAGASDGPGLRRTVLRAAAAVLGDLHRRGAFPAPTEARAWFVRCDRTTTTDADVAAGRLHLVVGFAPLRPAEFVVVRVMIPTAGRRGAPPR